MSCISFTYFIQYCSGRIFQYGRHCVFCIVCLGNTKKSFDRTKSTRVGTWFFEKSRNEVEGKNMRSRKKREEKKSLNKITWHGRIPHVFWFKTTKKESMAATKLGLFSKKVAAAAFVGGCHFSVSRT